MLVSQTFCVRSELLSTMGVLGVIFTTSLIIGVATPYRPMNLPGHYLRVPQGKKVFMNKHNFPFYVSGGNLPWVDYCNDFGLGKVSMNEEKIRVAMRTTHASGGNSIRVYVHCGGQHSPTFADQDHGMVVPVRQDLILDMKKFLDIALENRLLVFFVLWNFDKPVSKNVEKLIESPCYDCLASGNVAAASGLVGRRHVAESADWMNLEDASLENRCPDEDPSCDHDEEVAVARRQNPVVDAVIGATVDTLALYIVQLKLMVGQLKDHRALGGWEIVNEMDGLLSMEPGAGCQNVMGMTGGWAHTGYVYQGWESKKTFSMRNMQRFIGRQVKAILEVDEYALVTSSVTDGFQSDNSKYGRNFLSDSCLQSMGGGNLTFYSVHTYAKPSFKASSPAVLAAQDFQLDKPLVVGAFSQQCAGGRNSTDLFDYFYKHNYAGALISQWAERTDTTPVQCRGSWRESCYGMFNLNIEAFTQITVQNDLL